MLTAYFVIAPCIIMRIAGAILVTQNQAAKTVRFAWCRINRAGMSISSSFCRRQTKRS